MAALTVLELSPLEQVLCAAHTGHSHVGLRLVPATADEPVWDAIGDTALVRATRSALDDSGVRVLDVEIQHLKPDTRVRDFLPMLETGAVLGARHVPLARPAGQDARSRARRVIEATRRLLAEFEA